MHIQSLYLTIAAVLLSVKAEAIPLTSYQNLPASVRSQVNNSGFYAKGSSDDYWYALEVNPTTGELPVSLSGASIAIDFSGTPGAAVPAKAGFMGGTDGTNLRGIKTDTSGELQIDVLSSALPSGAATSALQGTGNTSLASIDTKTPALGQTTMAGSTPVAIASNQSTLNVAGTGTAGTAATGVVTVQGIASMTPLLATGTGTAGSAATGVVTVQGISSMTPLLVNGSGSTQPVSGTVSASNFPATADTNVGASGASTLRGVDAGRSLTTVLGSNNYASTSVTTAAYVQLIASTAAAVTRVYIQNTSSSILIMATGAGGAEVDRVYIGPGGSGVYDITIPASTRISMKALDSTASVGYFLFTGLQ